MNPAAGIKIALKAAHQLGFHQVGLLIIYKVGILTGHYRRTLAKATSRLEKFSQPAHLKPYPVLSQLPDLDTLRNLLGEQVSSLYAEADEILNGQVRLFGGQPVPLILRSSEPLKYWTAYEQGDNRVEGQDIKFTWEAGRFGWACTLARAYLLSGNEKYAESFWKHTEYFLESNPSFLGPHWASAQEVAIRLIALAFAIQAFTGAKSTTPARLNNLAKAIAIHAERIPATLVYARSQNNNHLITEALGLYTAAALLRDHPLAANWHRLGWKWLQNAFRSQILPDGTYIQHSTNYHRLMLQAALWMYAVHDTAFQSEAIPPPIHTSLASATEWIWRMLDPESGRVPNLGHNDGAYILPFTVCPYEDYRPLLAAAAQAFLHRRLEPSGPWQEMASWLCKPADRSLSSMGINLWNGDQKSSIADPSSPAHLHNPSNGSWASFRIAHFCSRPAHADQLHLDLWWRGMNMAQDPGTYLYNSAPPWDNSLTSPFVHNTVTVDGQEFMLRAGRFLYLDWAQAKVIDADNDIGLIRISAVQDGYRRLGVSHTRQVTALQNGSWEIIDQVTGSPVKNHTVRLHWLLPDLEYEVCELSSDANLTLFQVRLRTQFGWVSLEMSIMSPADVSLKTQKVKLQLMRAGQLVHGSGVARPIAGWFSPTYGVKVPALACILEADQRLPVNIKSVWVLPNEI